MFILTSNHEFSEINFLSLDKGYKLFITLGLLLAILTRIPLFPFHTYQAKIYNNLESSFKIIISSTLPIIGIYSFIRLIDKMMLNTPEINLILSVIIIVSILYIILKYQNIFMFYLINLGLFLAYILGVSYYHYLDIDIFLYLMFLNIIPNIYLALKRESVQNDG